MNNITIYVNESAITCEASARLIDVLKDNNIFIAHFCYHEALGADGNCRMCMVEIEGQKRPQIACDTFVKDGMRIATNNESINDVKRSILELELINHPVDCPICDQAGECSLQTYYMEFGLYTSHLDVEKNKKAKHVDLGKNVMLDQERCVLCARCTRFTQNITKSGELSIIGRGDQARVSTVPGHPLQNPYAMNVVDLCPVGALTSKDFRFQQRVWFLHTSNSLCHHCAKGCAIYIDYNQPKYETEKIYRYRPRKSAVNGHFICDDGRLSYKSENLLKQEQHHLASQPASINDVALYMNELIAKHNGKIELFSSASLSLEQLYGIKLFARNSHIAFTLYNEVDDTFEDDWLKSRYRSANIAASMLLNIHSTTSIEPKMSNHLFLFFITHEETLILRAQHLITQGYKVIIFSPYHHEQLTNADAYVSFAPFTHDSGTLLNIDNILQPFSTTTKHGIPLLEVLHHLDTTIAATNEEMHTYMRQHIATLKDVDFSTSTPLQGLQ